MKFKRRSSESTTMAETTAATAMADDVMRDILSRLPTKSITRFESVSKPWSTLIKSPAFISAHLRRSSRYPLILIRQFHNLSGGNFCFTLLDRQSNHMREVEIPFMHNLVCYPRIVGSALGLLCLDISPCYASFFVLWNLASRQFRAVPKPRIVDSNKPFWLVSSGFGYNAEVNDFKLVRIVYFNRDDDELPVVRAEVYSWMSGFWRAIDQRSIEDTIGSCVINQGQQAVNLNGVLHWLAYGIGKSSSHRFAVSFDMATEEFRKIPIPEIPNGVCVKVVGFKGSLALASYATMPVIHNNYGRPINRIEFWVFDEFGASDGGVPGWTKLQNFNLNYGYGSPIGMFSDSEFFLKRVELNGISLSMVDPSIPAINRLPITSSSDISCEFYSYVESVVPVDPGKEVLEESR